MNTARTNKRRLPRLVKILISTAFIVGLLIYTSYTLAKSLEETYEGLLSLEIRDRNGITIKKYQNEKDLYATPIEGLPENLTDLLLEKEDTYFYLHPGVNPISIGRATLAYIKNGRPGGSSTITQQLVKILLGNEQHRTLTNKLKELLYVISLEIQLSKAEILTMYLNSVYLGNQAQGFSVASNLYFDKSPKDLTEQEMIQLLATLSSPSVQNPWKKANENASKLLADTLDVPLYDISSTKNKSHSYQKSSFFEIHSLDIKCEVSCDLTIDSGLNEQIREILDRNISYSYDRGARNAAAVVIKIPENELLAIVGSKDPSSQSEGSQINMALEPRPIGSTVKPLIYGKGFELGLRPYSLVEDREYKYPIATGFSLYPKNYDGQYRGIISLHEALSNSLNVPTVKVLEYISLNQFYDFLENDLEFIPIQDLHSYQFGIALGGLEMDLLTLTHYFTLFAQGGKLKPIQVGITGYGDIVEPPQSNLQEEKQIFDLKHTQLVNKILSDRSTGVNQFGLKSNLNLTQNNYAVKTGTSRDFHDSWVVGFTPDFVVGVWLGNSENTALQQISGQSGAGRAWQEIMELLFSTEYNNKTPFAFDQVADIHMDGSIEFGLLGDIPERYRNVMLGAEIILSPHNQDLFEFKQGTTIPLNSRTEVDWYIDGVYLESGTSVDFNPVSHGTYEVEARQGENREIISLEIVENTF